MSAAAKTGSKGAQVEQQKPPRRRIKKVKGHGGHHGGSWKVAYADFVTAMMALFLVLWLLSQADTKIKQSIASYFRNPGVFASQSGGVLKGRSKVDPTIGISEKDEEQTLFNVSSTLKKNLDAMKKSETKERVKIKMTEQGLDIQILDKAERVSFDSGSAVLNPTAKEILAEIAKSICELPNPLTIGGHTDQHLFPAGSTYTNWELSADRANAARRELQNNCVKAEQIRRVIGYADTELLYPNDPFAPGNRRINIIVWRMKYTDKLDLGAKGADKNEKIGDTKVVEKNAKAKESEEIDAEENSAAEKNSVKEKTSSSGKKGAAEKNSPAETKISKDVLGDIMGVKSKPITASKEKAHTSERKNKAAH